MNALPKRELLTSQRGPDGHWHACYPTATLTLCGQPVHAFKRGRKWPPDCVVCVATARAFHRIDQSMPGHWLPAGRDAA